MNLEEYLNQKERIKRIIIVKDVSRAGCLIRSFERKTDTMIENVSCVSLRTMAEVLFHYFESEKGFKPEFNLIDETASTALLRSVMRDNLKELQYFGNEKLLSMATCAEIYAKLNLIRCCGWSGEEDSSDPRVIDLKFITRQFEESLRTNKIFDYPALLEHLIVSLQKYGSARTIDQCFDANIVYLDEDAEKLTDRELQFLDQITDKKIVIWEQVPDRSVFTGIAPKVSFFRGYGSYNEANYVVNDILKRGICLGDVCVLYTSSSQLDAISSAFGGNGLRASYTSGKSMKDNIFVALARRILTWARSDFSEKELEAVLGSHGIRNSIIDDSGNMKNAIGGKSYFNHVLAARNRRQDRFILGWGYSRNCDFVNGEECLASDEQTRKALEVHKDLLDIFGENGVLYDEENAVNPSVVFDKLCGFIWKYHNRSADLEAGKGAINNLKNVIALEDSSLPLAETIDFIDDLLRGLTETDALAPDSAEIALLSEWKYLDRKNVYILGLSLKDTQDSKNESPVLSDNEMERWLGRGFKPTIINRAGLKSLNIYRTLSSFAGEMLSFGYSFYDTVMFTNNSPSAFFREALELCGKKIENIPEFVYGNPTSGAERINADSASANDCVLKIETSSSQIEVLIDCPKKFFYEQIEHIPDNQFTECNPGQWLDAVHYGSLFHSVAQRYTNAVLIKEASAGYPNEVDENCLKSVIYEEAEKMAKEFPVPSQNQKKKEIGDFIKVCCRYFNNLHHSLCEEDLGWRILFTEKRFDKERFKLEDYLGYSYSFLFNGVIDRIDYKIDRARNCICLRIVDYKTGKAENKEKEIEMGKAFQHVVYKNALMNTLHPDVVDKISELENNPGVKNWSCVFSDFTYHFPKETEMRVVIIEDKDIEDLNMIRLKTLLTIIKEMNEFPDHIQFYEFLKQKENQSELFNKLTTKKGAMKEEETKKCLYCNYRDLCVNARGGNL